MFNTNPLSYLSKEKNLAFTEPPKQSLLQRILAFFSKLFYGEISENVNILEDYKALDGEKIQAVYGIINLADKNAVDKIAINIHSELKDHDKNISAGSYDTEAIVITIGSIKIFEQPMLNTPPSNFDSLVEKAVRHYFDNDPEGTINASTEIFSNVNYVTKLLKEYETTHSEAHEMAEAGSIGSIIASQLKVAYGHNKTFALMTLELHDGNSMIKILELSNEGVQCTVNAKIPTNTPLPIRHHTHATWQALLVLSTKIMLAGEKIQAMFKLIDSSNVDTVQLGVRLFYPEHYSGVCSNEHPKNPTTMLINNKKYFDGVLRKTMSCSVEPRIDSAIREYFRNNSKTAIKNTIEIFSNIDRVAEILKFTHNIDGPDKGIEAASAVKASHIEIIHGKIKSWALLNIDMHDGNTIIKLFELTSNGMGFCKTDVLPTEVLFSN